MTGQPFRVNSRKFDLSLRRSWTTCLLGRSDDRLTLEGFFEDDILHPDLGLIAKGTRSVETFLFDRWYNYFVFYEPTGPLRNYYINISMPPNVSDGVVDYVDLDIDLIVWPDGRVEILDVEEFEENGRLYGYPADVVEMAMKTKSEIARDPFRFLTPIVSAT